MTPPAGYAKDYAVAVAVDLTGAITYTDGTIAFDDSGNYQYSSANTVTVRFDRAA